MPGYTVRRLDEVTNIFEGNYPGEMRMITYEIDAEQVALTYRRCRSTPAARARTATATGRRRSCTS